MKHPTVSVFPHIEIKIRKKQPVNAILVCRKIPKCNHEGSPGERGMEGTPGRRRTAFQKSLVELFEYIHNWH